MAKNPQDFSRNDFRVPADPELSFFVLTILIAIIAGTCSGLTVAAVILTRVP